MQIVLIINSYCLLGILWPKESHSTGFYWHGEIL